MPIFCAVYEGKPAARAEDAVEVGGASIVCWIKAISAAEAAKLARQTIEERLWIIVAVDEEWTEVTKSGVPLSSSPYFEQAAIDGECYVFHTWNNEADSGNLAR